MRHGKRGRKLNRTSSHRKALMSNMASSLVLHKRIRTTDAKAKELRSFADRLVTYAKRGDVHGRRLILRKIHGQNRKNIANILIHDIAPNFNERNGGYTRIIKLNNRKNDNAPISIIEFVDFKHTAEDTSNDEKTNSDKLLKDKDS